MTEIEKHLNVHQRLAAAMGEVDYIQKESKKGMSYTIVSHDSVTAKVRPVLLRNGIVYYPVRCEHTHDGNRAECSMSVRFVNIDEPTDFFEVPTFGYGIDTQDKGPGKAMSYAVKYALLKALGLETGDDPETESIEHVPTTQEPVQKPKNEEARKAYKYLQDDMRKINSVDDMRRWFTDADVLELRRQLPDYWDAELKKEWMQRGKELASASPEKQIADAVGGIIVDERYHSVLEAGQ